MSARLWLSLGFLVIMTWLWYPHFMAPKKPVDNDKDQVVAPDYIAQQLKQTVYNQTGEISHKVSADRMEMYQDLGFTHFTKPVFTVYSEVGVWQLSAKEATLYDSEKLILEQDVVAKNLSKNAMLDKISAAKVIYTLSDKLLQSSQKVIMTGPSVEIVGQGLNANLETEVVDLINHTKTIYYDQ